VSDGASDPRDFLRDAGRRWASQTPEGVDPRWRVDPDVELYEEDEDTGGGTGLMRVTHSGHASLEREGGMLRATATGVQKRRGVARLRTLLLGEPLSSARHAEERLTKVKALAVLSSDALSSVAYATEQTLAVLLLAGAGALAVAPGVAIAIIVLLVVAGISHVQAIRAYPKGGGAYIVASDNLGPVAGLVAGASLMTDYILTVAVSVSAGVGAVTSALPAFAPYTVEIGLGIILLLVWGNLRGIREAGSIFALPTYIFLLGMAALVVGGLFHLATQGAASPLARQTNYIGPLPVETFALFLVLKAFASGCTALTGVEAISDGVPAFKPPEWRNARTTLIVMVAILAVMFTGITFLAHQFELFPDYQLGPGLPAELQNPANYTGTYQTLLSKLNHVVFDDGPVYFGIQAATAVILMLAANTSFSDFPRLLYFMARDKYAPSQFTNLGDRLAFSNGIITLGLLAGLLFFIFRGSVDALIPLYTIGVFASFTLAQLGMVVRWRRLGRSGTRDERRGWRRSVAMNLGGAMMTGAVLVIAAYTKFVYGAWIVLVLIPVIVVLALAVHRHYAGAKRRVQAETPLSPGDVHPVAIVPIADLTDVQLQTLALARRLADKVVAVIISDDRHRLEEIQEKWEVWGNHVKLDAIYSPYRSFIRPFLDYLDAVENQNQGSTILVILPEMVHSRWWHQFLHNQTALKLKAALLFRPGTVVVNVPYHLLEVKEAASQ
jgi:amino acid transporter